MYPVLKDFFYLFKYINKTGFRACVKELFVNRHDPLSVSYAVLPGKIEGKIFVIYMLQLCLLEMP